MSDNPISTAHMVMVWSFPNRHELFMILLQLIAESFFNGHRCSFLQVVRLLGEMLVI